MSQLCEDQFRVIGNVFSESAADTNANVFYELGLAHALAKPVILVTASMEDVPFDLRALRVLEYDKNKPTWGEGLKKSITTAIDEILASPLDSVLPAFLDVNDAKTDKSVTPQDKAVLELRQELDLMRRQLDHERGRSRVETIDADDAQELIRNYVARGLPRGFILRRLTERGAPERWVEAEIDVARRERDELEAATKAKRTPSPKRKVAKKKSPPKKKTSSKKSSPKKKKSKNGA